MSSGNVFCTACGTQNLVQSNFCFKCGAKLQKTIINASNLQQPNNDDNKDNNCIAIHPILPQNDGNKRLIGYNTLGKVTRIKSFESESDYGFGAVKQANEWMEQNPDIIVLDIQHFVHPVVKFYVWVNIVYTVK